MDRTLLTRCVLLLALALPGAASAAKKSAPSLDDLSIKPTRHGVACPLPKVGPCVVRKPVGTRYRVLTPGANLEDMGDYWLIDWGKLKDPKSTRERLRIIGENGDVHDIEMRFPPDPAAKDKPVVKETEMPKEAPKEADKEK